MFQCEFEFKLVWSTVNRSRGNNLSCALTPQREPSAGVCLTYGTLISHTLFTTAKSASADLAPPQWGWNLLPSRSTRGRVKRTFGSSIHNCRLERFESQGQKQEVFFKLQVCLAPPDTCGWWYCVCLTTTNKRLINKWIKVLENCLIFYSWLHNL